MEAAIRLRCSLIAIIAIVAAGVSPCEAANYRTQNFIIQAPSAQLAQTVGVAAEKYRKELATYWLGEALPPWQQPCPIRVVAGRLAAQGVTTYNLQPVRDFQMEVVGTPERILDSVLPHEITHTILATHFGRPLPRWADEGICTTVEHASERSKHEAKLREFLRTRRGIAMNRLFLLTEYPNDVLPMYAQGYSVCRFLIDQKGPRTFIDFLQDYMDQRSWTANVRKHYGYESLTELQEHWLSWVSSGSGSVDQFAKIDKTRSQIALASATTVQPKSLPPASVLPAPRKKQPNRGQPNQLAHADGKKLGGALATSLDTGWYARQRDAAQNALAGQPSGQTLPPHVVRPIAPPSVRDSGSYSASQPQSEQQMSRAGTPLYRIVPGTIRRYR